MIRTLLSVSAVCLAVAASSAPARAAFIIYNEATQGDLTGDPSVAMNLARLNSGDRLSVMGTLNGGTAGSTADGPDESDVFNFTSLDRTTIDVSSVTPGTSGGVAIFLFRLQNNTSTFVNAGIYSSTTTNVFGSLAAGTYQIQLVPSGNSGTAGYTVTANVAVPEPSSVVLAGSGFALVLGAIGRRRRRCPA